MERVLSGRASRRPTLLADDGGAAAAGAIVTTDPLAEAGRCSRVTDSWWGGWRRAAGMIHPRLATMLAVVTTDYPLEPGEPIEFLRPAVERELQPDLRRRRVLDERRGRAARERRERGRAEPATRRAIRGCTPRRLRRRSRARSSRTEKARPSCSRSPLPARQSDAEAEAVARRIATSPLVKTAAFGRDPNWGRVLAAAGSAPWNGGFAHVDVERLTRRVRRNGGLRPRRAHRCRRPSWAARRLRSTSTSGSARAPLRTSRPI